MAEYKCTVLTEKASVRSENSTSGTTINYIYKGFDFVGEGGIIPDKTYPNDETKKWIKMKGVPYYVAVVYGKDTQLDVKEILPPSGNVVSVVSATVTAVMDDGSTKVFELKPSS